MAHLLDTHVWIWSQEEPEKLSADAQALLTDDRSRTFVSPVSTLEIARLCQQGALAFKVELGWWIDESLKALRASTTEMNHAIALEACSLPDPFHPDPADRLLVATARCRDLKLITADARILAYPHVDTVSAI